jgi:hypothetical protein
LLLRSGAAVITLGGTAAAASTWVLAQAKEANIEKWMNDWMSAGKAPSGTVHVQKFAEPVYILLKPISWKPNIDQTDKFESVEVPKGFVTDFASIPRPFWTLLRPDGEYTFAAIVHDYLYWTQSRPREVADEIFLHAMEDFRVSVTLAAIIHAAVRVGGSRHWEKAAGLKAKGEKRILKRFPDDPRVRWEDWKRRADVFA